MKLRQRILTKLAQTPVVLNPPPTIPSDLFSHLAEGYNSGTVSLLQGLVNQLGIALHYASQGKDNFQKIINNNMDLSGAFPDQKNIGTICQKIFNSFLNRKAAFKTKVSATNIHTWSDYILNSQEYSNLSQINPTSLLAIKLQENLKTLILNYLNQIKQQNPITT
jgi:hypothetical protein